MLTIINRNGINSIASKQRPINGLIFTYDLKPIYWVLSFSLRIYSGAIGEILDLAGHSLSLLLFTGGESNV